MVLPTSFLRAPDAAEFDVKHKPLTRPSCSFENQVHDSVAPENQIFEKQYASNYFVRLQMLKQATTEAARSKWSDIPVLESISKYRSYPQNSPVGIVGTLFKDMRLKPNVLEELQRHSRILDQHMVPSASEEISRLCSGSDNLFIEDSESRIAVVVGDNRNLIDRVVTGLIVALRGRVGEGGVFEASEICFPGREGGWISPVPPRPPCRVLFVSGLNVGHPQSCPLGLELLKQFVISGNLSRVIIAGDSLTNSSGLSVADAFLAEISSTVPVDLIPGPNDPTNFALPQQPLHSAFFPLSKKFRNFQALSNPYDCKLEGVRVLGSSGQGVADVLQYSSVENSIDALTLCLEARHLAPTAPDTLACYPVSDIDPLVIQGDVHVFFSGNHKDLGVKVLQDERGVSLCVALPAFSVTGQAVIVDLNNLVDFRIANFLVT